MPSDEVPSTMRAWQYTTSNGGLENTMKLNASAPVPKPKPNQHLVQVLASSLNPVDHKPAEVPILFRFAVSKPAIPGLDFVGRIVTPAAGSDLTKGQLVFGGTGTQLFAGGALGEYAVAKKDVVVALPDGLSLTDASTIYVCGSTAYQAIVPHTKAGQRIFINGGSGGTGVYSIQVAKNAGLHVTTSCSTPNVELCRSLGADVVLDYKKQPLIEQLKAQKPFDHVVDNVGFDTNLYWKAHTYTNPSAKYIFIGAAPTFSFFSFSLTAMVLPGFLGGGKRHLEMPMAAPNAKEMGELAKSMAEGKIKVPIDETFPFDKANEAMRKLKTHRAKGKIIVDVDLKSGGA